MVAGFLRAAARIYMKGIAGRGLSANEALSQVRLAGYRYRRSIMLRDWRTINGLKGKEAFVRKLKNTTKIPRNAIVNNVFRTPRKFRFLADVLVRDTNTGEQLVRNVTAFADEIHTKQSLLDKLLDIWTKGDYGSEYEFLGIELIAIEHNEKLPF